MQWRLLVVGIWSCSACGEPPPPVAEAEQTHSLNGLQVTVPSTWTLSPADQSARLQAAGVRRDPQADVHVLALSAAPGPAPALSLMTIAQSAEYSQGMGSVRSAMEGMEGSMRSGAQSRGVALEFEGTCTATSCDISYRMGPTGARQRVWRDGGRMNSAGYTCAGEAGCAAMETAVLPPPPSSADSVDAL
ncbi:MAG: hypothetical protein AB8H86_23920 [Polyangiales bacterium]